MITSIIIDDEDGGRKSLSNLLRDNCPNVKIIAMADSVKHGLEAIHKFNPELVFLDIQLRNENGFDLLKKVGSIDFDVIFVTAYDKYAVKAFKFSALDYLLKPIDIDELKNAIHKVEEKKSSKSSDDKFDVFLQNQKFINSAAQKIALPTSDGLIFIQVSDVIRCESDDNYTNFILRDGKKILVSRTIKEFEELLADFNFFRIHQSYLINMEEVVKFVRDEGGYIVMSDNSKIPISRRKKEELMTRLPGIAQ